MKYILLIILFTLNSSAFATKFSKDEPIRFATLKYQISKFVFTIDENENIVGLHELACEGQDEIPVYDGRGKSGSAFPSVTLNCESELYGNKTNVRFGGRVLILDFNGVSEKNYSLYLSYSAPHTGICRAEDAVHFATNTLNLKKAKFYLDPCGSLNTSQPGQIEGFTATLEVLNP